LELEIGLGKELIVAREKSDGVGGVRQNLLAYAGSSTEIPQ
jgi:hypothetical protein